MKFSDLMDRIQEYPFGKLGRLVREVEQTDAVRVINATVGNPDREAPVAVLAEGRDDPLVQLLLLPAVRALDKLGLGRALFEPVEHPAKTPCGGHNHLNPASVIKAAEVIPCGTSCTITAIATSKPIVGSVR